MQLNQFESNLHALEHVEEVVHARQVPHILENGHQQGGSDGEGAGQQNPSETRPTQVQETLRTSIICCTSSGSFRWEIKRKIVRGVTDWPPWQTGQSTFQSWWSSDRLQESRGPKCRALLDRRSSPEPPPVRVVNQTESFTQTETNDPTDKLLTAEKNK